MLTGYFTLTGNASLATFETPDYSETLVANSTKGALALSTDLTAHGFAIPSRDKQVLLFGEYNDDLAEIDSMFPGCSYQEKLERLGLGKSLGFILNKTEHGSVAILGCPFHYGLHDTRTNSSFYMFTDDPNRLAEVLRAAPLRYLIYRFPENPPVIFIQAEGVCSKWWRWTKSHQSTLHSFNALEHKLYGLQKA